MNGKKRVSFCLPFLMGLLLAAGCAEEPTVESPNTAEVTMASSQDADGYIYEARNETVYATGSVNVRRAATAQSDIVGVLDEGDSVKRVAWNASWSKVEYEGEIRYVTSAYLSLLPPGSETQPVQTEKEEPLTEKQTEASTEETKKSSAKEQEETSAEKQTEKPDKEGKTPLTEDQTEFQEKQQEETSAEERTEI